MGGAQATDPTSHQPEAENGERFLQPSPHSAARMILTSPRTICGTGQPLAEVTLVILHDTTYRDTYDTIQPGNPEGSIEMLILSLVEDRARHGYEIGKLIERRSGGRLVFALPTLYRHCPARSARLAQGTLGREGRRTSALLLQPDADRSPRAASAARNLAVLCRAVNDVLGVSHA